MSIPTVVTDNHNEVFYPWAESKLRDATLFHVDAHADMRDTVKAYAGKNTARYALELGISRFICSAIDAGILHDVAWLNPHSETRRLQYLGSSNRALKTQKEAPLIFWKEIAHQRDVVDGENKASGMLLRGVDGYLAGRITGPLVVDIDLDGFCCCQVVEHVPRGYEGMHGWERRLKESLEVLARLPRPTLVTITRSQAVSPLPNGKFRPKDARVWVPRREVDRIQYDLLRGLESMYGELDVQSVDWMALLQSPETAQEKDGTNRQADAPHLWRGEALVEQHDTHQR